MTPEERDSYAKLLILDFIEDYGRFPTMVEAFVLQLLVEVQCSHDP